MACPTGKVMHRGKRSAHKALRNVQSRTGRLVPYFCPKCRHWHLGNTPQTRLERMNNLFDRIAQLDAARMVDESVNGVNHR